jgi:hypothetical protein
MNWAWGITTVPERIDTLLPRTLSSLEGAGFVQPRLFVDGCDDPTPFWAWDASVTCRGDRIGNFGNWYLAMVELFCRNPVADRYLIFEDDVIACRSLREYLERLPMPENGYCNLFNNGERNYLLTKRAINRQGWVLSDNRGYGALGLMFNRETVVRLLGAIEFVKHRLYLERPKNGGLPRGECNVDGAVIFALRNCGKPVISEYVHKPSLIQHIGSEVSTLGHHRPAMSRLFPGEDFDLRVLMRNWGRRESDREAQQRMYEAWELDE